jgi:hypothetical protein
MFLIPVVSVLKLLSLLIFLLYLTVRLIQNIFSNMYNYISCFNSFLLIKNYKK